MTSGLNSAAYASSANGKGVNTRKSPSGTHQGVRAPKLTLSEFWVKTALVSAATPFFFIARASADIAAAAFPASRSLVPALAAIPAAALPAFDGHGTNTLASSMPFQAGTLARGVNPNTAMPLSFLLATSAATSC